MYELKKNCKLVGAGPSSYKKRIYPNIYIASHVIPAIYAAAVAKCSQV